MIDTPETGAAAARRVLIDRFDRMVAGRAAFPDAAVRELRGLALVYDIPPDAAPVELWSRVRAVLSRQVDGEAAPVATDPLTLMVVEDDADMAADLTAILTEAGHRVVGPFQEAETAEAAAGLHALDLALLDINLTGERDGVSLAQALKSRWGVPVMFLSGDVTAAARHAHLAEALLVKPFRSREVVAAVGKVAAASA